MERKASDYSGLQDVNRNIKACEMVGICTAEQGVMIRLFDKFQRLSNLIKPGVNAKVKDESVEDTIHDARNYLAILLDLRKEKEDARAAEPVGNIDLLLGSRPTSAGPAPVGNG